MRILPRFHLIRHGETEWSLSGRHTSRTDVPLTVNGEEQARRLGARLRGLAFSQVLSSPRRRARQTCELAGFAAAAETTDELREWDYGEYEGLTTAQIHSTRGDWNLFDDGAPNGETPAEVYARAKRLVTKLRALEGDVAVFSHGHFLRVLATAWTGLPVADGRRFGLGTASLSILGFEHDHPDEPIIALWNDTSAANAK